MNRKPNKTSFKKGRTPWNKGKKGVQEAWNKGLTKATDSRLGGWKHTEEYKELMSKKLKGNQHGKGKKVSEETKRKISKANNGHKVSQAQRERLSNYNKSLTKEQLQIRVTKAYLTKKLNNTLNSSKPEEDLYQELLKENINKTIYRQYKDERYPYYCDFYIVEDDLFIELNAHWTHGGHPFDSNSLKDQEKLALWKEKAKVSKFYQQAIYIWTELDPKKAKRAEEQNLNYRVIY